MQIPAQELVRFAVEQALVVRHRFQITPVLVEDEQDVGHGTGDGAQMRLALAQGALVVQAGVEVVQQRAEQGGRRAHDQQVGQAERGIHRCHAL